MTMKIYKLCLILSASSAALAFDFTKFIGQTFQSQFWILDAATSKQYKHSERTDPTKIAPNSWTSFKDLQKNDPRETCFNADGDVTEAYRTHKAILVKSSVKLIEIEDIKNSQGEIIGYIPVFHISETKEGPQKSKYLYEESSWTVMLDVSRENVFTKTPAGTEFANKMEKFIENMEKESKKKIYCIKIIDKLGIEHLDVEAFRKGCFYPKMRGWSAAPGIARQEFFYNTASWMPTDHSSEKILLTQTAEEKDVTLSSRTFFENDDVISSAQLVKKGILEHKTCPFEKNIRNAGGKKISPDGERLPNEDQEAQSEAMQCLPNIYLPVVLQYRGEGLANAPLEKLCNQTAESKTMKAVANAISASQSYVQKFKIFVPSPTHAEILVPLGSLEIRPNYRRIGSIYLQGVTFNQNANRILKIIKEFDGLSVEYKRKAAELSVLNTFFLLNEYNPKAYPGMTHYDMDSEIPKGAALGFVAHSENCFVRPRNLVFPSS
jgi:hypothetical protein